MNCAGIVTDGLYPKQEEKTGLRSGAMVYVSDAAGGAMPAFSYGANWRRGTDRVIVS